MYVISMASPMQLLPFTRKLAGHHGSRHCPDARTYTYARRSRCQTKRKTSDSHAADDGRKQAQHSPRDRVASQQRASPTSIHFGVRRRRRRAPSPGMSGSELESRSVPFSPSSRLPPLRTSTSASDPPCVPSKPCPCPCPPGSWLFRAPRTSTSTRSSSTYSGRPTSPIAGFAPSSGRNCPNVAPRGVGGSATRQSEISLSSYRMEEGRAAHLCRGRRTRSRRTRRCGRRGWGSGRRGGGGRAGSRRGGRRRRA